MEINHLLTTGAAAVVFTNLFKMKQLCKFRKGLILQCSLMMVKTICCTNAKV